jgi:hypothetical protein
MERLTFRTELGVSIDKEEDCPTCSICWDCDNPPRKCLYINDALEKLADYEDLEEQGRLLKLPCKMGDTLYKLVPNLYRKYVEIKIAQFVINKNGIYFITNKGVSWSVDKIGKNIFLTKSEAEAKLKELRGNQNGKV